MTALQKSALMESIGEKLMRTAQQGDKRKGDKRKGGRYGISRLPREPDRPLAGLTHSLSRGSSDQLAFINAGAIAVPGRRSLSPNSISVLC
jgi:hypothetical protein